MKTTNHPTPPDVTPPDTTPKNTDKPSDTARAKKKSSPQPQMNTPDPGKLLREARQKKNLSIEEVAKQLKLNPQYISDIENNHYDFISSAVYARGYLQTYGRLVDVDVKQLIDAFNARDLIQNTPPKRDPFELYKKHIANKQTHKAWMVYGGVGFIGIACLLGIIHLYQLFTLKAAPPLAQPLIKLSSTPTQQQPPEKISPPPAAAPTPPQKQAQEQTATTNPPQQPTSQQHAQYDDDEDNGFY